MNDHVYEYRERISFSKCDIYNKLSVTALIDMFQDASIFQSQDAGVGIDYLKSRNLLWVINYWEIEIENLPVLCDTVYVGTYPCDFKSFMGYRNFYLRDEEGKYLVKANTTWTMIDTLKNRPEKVPYEVREAYTLGPKLEMTYSPRKIAIPDADKCEMIRPSERIVELHHLDRNMHMNNCQYISFALTAIDEQAQICSLRADYRRQAHLKDVIYPVVFREDNKRTVVLNDEQGKPYSVICVCLR